MDMARNKQLCQGKGSRSYIVVNAVVANGTPAVDGLKSCFFFAPCV